jgi:transcriptional regulator with XRE-family HTH domain
MSSVREEIAKNLLYYRKRAGMTQKELAAAIGAKNTSVSNWEKAQNSMDIETLARICKLFGVSVSEMLGAFAYEPVSVNPHEHAVLDAYRAQPDVVRSAVDRMLGVPPEIVADPVDLAAELAQNLPKKVPTGK